MKKEKHERSEACSHTLLAIRDTMELLSGKWKVQIIGTLIMTEKLKFMDLKRTVDGIGAKMLSKELQELEINQLVKRTVCDTKPITVEYEITEYGKSLQKVIYEIGAWGVQHRKHLFNSTNDYVLLNEKEDAAGVFQTC
jgi:DNA-binding HxlR family transcriptional regulator